MNVHPLLVHFPIALLTTYAVLELVPLSRWFPRIAWDSVRPFLLYLGTLFLFPTIIAGGIAAGIEGESELIEAHEHAALITGSMFVLASVLYLWGNRFPQYARAIHWAKKVLALGGILGLTIVGALGATYVYGSGNDPFTSFIASLFGF